MRGLIQLLSPDTLDRKICGCKLRIIIPTFVVVLLVGGLFSPLFDLTQAHGVPTLKLYVQHMYFETIAGLGGLYAASFCPHWRHKIPLMIGIDLLSTLALVTLVG